MKTKFLFTLIALLFLIAGAEAQTCVKYSDTAKLGGKIVTAGTTSTTSAIKSFPGATVDIYNTGTLVHTSLFSDNACSVVKGNPLTVDATTGAFSFYLAPTRIDIRVSPAGGTPSPFTGSDILIPTYTAQSIKETSGPTMLTIGAIADKQFLKRSGATLIGAAVFGWFNVQDYGVGDAGINGAIDACNAAGKGVVYLPTAAPLTLTATAHTITCNGSMVGDGGEFVDPSVVAPSQINFTSASTNAFNIASRHFLVRGIGLSNTAGTTPTAGYGFNVTGSALYQKVDFENVSVYRFFHALHEDGGLWHAWNFTASSSVDYQIFVENSSNDDAGDWDIDGLKCLAVGTYPPLCLKIKNGGGKVSNSKILGTVDGIVCVSGANTSLLAVSTTSIELFKGNGITINGGTPAGSWANVQLNQLEFEPDPTNLTGFGIAAIATANLQLSNINGNNGSSGAPLIVAGAGSSNWSVGPITISGWGRDIQSGGSYTGAPLPASAVSAETIASNKIMPQYQIFHLGAGLLKNIFLNTTTMSPYDNRNYTIYIIPDAAFTWDATGNLGNSGTAVVGKMIVAQYFRNDKWYLSQ